MSKLVCNHYKTDTYVRETFIPKGQGLKSFIHSYDHLNILGMGVVTILEGNQMTSFTAPCPLVFKANTEYRMLAVTDVVWYCVHNNTLEITDLEGGV